MHKAASFKPETWLQGLEILPPNPLIQEQVLQAWDQRCKPLRALGRLESLHARLAAIQGEKNPVLGSPLALVFVGDHGIVEEGVSQCGPEVTAQVFANMAEGKSTVAIWAKHFKAPLWLCDCGIACSIPGFLAEPHVRCHRHADGAPSRNFLHGPAMDERAASLAIRYGYEQAREALRLGHRFLAIGEMGIGNSSSATALIAKLLDRPVGALTGRGAGLSDAALKNKRQVLERALERHAGAQTPLAIAAALGGPDILAMTGAYLALAEAKAPIILDGLLAMAAALLARAFAPAILASLLPSHRPREAAGQAACEALGLHPFMDLDLALGEGAGAFTLYPLLQMTIALYAELPRFEAGGVEAYEDFGKEP